MKRGTPLILFLCILAGLAFFVRPDDLAASGKMEVDYSYEAEGAWTYPVQPGTEEWESLSFQEQKASCQVPQEALDAMDTEALLETALNYPYNSNLYAYDDDADGFRVLLGWNDALAALQERADRHETVRTRLQDMDEWLEMVGVDASAGSLFRHHVLAVFAEYME